MQKKISEDRRCFGWLLINVFDGPPSLFDLKNADWLRNRHGSLNSSTDITRAENFFCYISNVVKREVDANGMFDIVLLGDLPHSWIDDIRVAATLKCISDKLQNEPFYERQPIRLFACLSGVGRDASFAQQLANHMGVTVHAPIGFVRFCEEGKWDVSGFKLLKGVASINMDWLSEMGKFDSNRTQYIEKSDMQNKYSVTRRHFGWWRESGIVEAPPLFDWTDRAWKPDDHNQIVAYLEDAKCVCATTSPDFCPLCPTTLRAFHYQSDGTWIWSSSLAHLVRDHNVRLPDDFVASIRSNHYMPPTAKFDLSKLDWPWGPVGGWHPFH